MLELILILAKAGGILLCLWGSNRLARKLTLIGRRLWALSRFRWRRRGNSAAGNRRFVGQDPANHHSRVRSPSTLRPIYAYVLGPADPDDK